MFLNRKRWLAFLVLAAGIAGFVFLKATRPEKTRVETRERTWQVEVMEVQPTRLAPLLTLYGQVETPTLLKAAAPSESRVAEVLVKEGDRVAPGDLLLSLDPRDFKPRVAQARAEVADLEAQIENERLRNAADQRALQHEKRLLALSASALERAQRLKKQNLGSDAELDQAREAQQRQALAVTSRQLTVDEHEVRMQQLAARLRRAQAQLEQAELDWERSRTTAPFTGYVAKVHVAAGDHVKSGTSLVTLYPQAQLEVRAKIPAPFQAELQRALAANAELHATATLGGEQIDLRLDRIAGEADPSGVDALFAIETGAELLRLGTMLPLQLQRLPQANAVAVPYQALYGSDRVYTVVDGRMRAVRITPLGDFTSRDGDTQLLVSSSELQPGDQIVVTHLPNAISGLRVTPVDDTAEAVTQPLPQITASDK